MLCTHTCVPMLCWHASGAAVLLCYQASAMLAQQRSLLTTHGGGRCFGRARPRPCNRSILLPVRASAPPTATTNWTDEYTDLGDRVDQPPLPLPAIAKPVRVTIVRHGQSTWNAESRVQGSSNQSVLSEKGKQQARASQAMVSEALVSGQQSAARSQ